MQTPFHYRRCHVCSHVNSDEKPILKCKNCTKALAPFYYFDERELPVLSEFTLRPPSIQGAYSPIHGLTAYWEVF